MRPGRRRASRSPRQVPRPDPERPVHQAPRPVCPTHSMAVVGARIAARDLRAQGATGSPPRGAPGLRQGRRGWRPRRQRRTTESSWRRHRASATALAHLETEAVPELPPPPPSHVAPPHCTRPRRTPPRGRVAPLCAAVSHPSTRPCRTVTRGRIALTARGRVAPPPPTVQLAPPPVPRRHPQHAAGQVPCGPCQREVVYSPTNKRLLGRGGVASPRLVYYISLFEALDQPAII